MEFHSQYLNYLYYLNSGWAVFDSHVRYQINQRFDQIAALIFTRHTILLDPQKI